MRAANVRDRAGATVLVMAADGFIGIRLVERRLFERVKVRALCCSDSNGSRGWRDGLERGHGGGVPGLETVPGDVRESSI